MSPAPRRGRRAAKEATTTAQKRKPGRQRKPAPVEEDEDEDDEEDEQPRGGRRQARDYGVTGEQLQQMRDDGMGWLEIMEEVGAKSAIPLRKILHAYQAEQDEDFQLDIEDGEAIVAARDEEGLGWSQIAARCGEDVSVSDVKHAYEDAGGENTEGRAYKDKEGNVHFKIGSTSALDDDEDEEDEDELDEDEEEDEEPAPKRGRGRTSTRTAPAKKPTAAKKAAIAKKPAARKKSAPAARPRRGRSKK